MGQRKEGIGQSSLKYVELEQQQDIQKELGSGPIKDPQ